MASNSQGDLSILDTFPELTALGRDRVQELSNQWVLTPKAKEFAVTEVFIAAKGAKLVLGFSVTVSHDYSEGEDYFFPMDDLLGFIIKHGIASEEQRGTLQTRLRQARLRGGRDVFQRFRIANVGPKLALFLECKNPECKRPLRTQYRKHERDVIREWKATVDCPRCGKTYDYNQKDVHFRPELADETNTCAVNQDIKIDGGISAVVVALHVSGRVKTLKLQGIHHLKAGTLLRSLRCVIEKVTTDFQHQTTELELSDG